MIQGGFSRVRDTRRRANGDDDDDDLDTDAQRYAIGRLGIREYFKRE